MPTANLDLPRGVELTRLRTFVAVVDNHGYTSAATQLGTTRQAVYKSVKDLQTAAFAGVALVENRDGRLVTTDLGSAVYARALEILKRLAEFKGMHLKDFTHPTIGYLPHHAEFVAPLLIDNGDRLTGEVLEERHRSSGAFQTEVIEHLRTRDYDIVIGPAPQTDRSDGLIPSRLYTTEYVALVDRKKHPRSELTFAEAARQPLLLPPESTRAGTSIRTNLRTDDPDDKWPEGNVRQVAHGTKVLVIHAVAGAGICIVPADIAFVFSSDGTLSGSDRLRKQFHWVRMVASDGNPRSHDVFATHRSPHHAEDEQVANAVRDLHSAVEERYAGSDFITCHPYLLSKPTTAPATKLRRG